MLDLNKFPIRIGNDDGVESYSSTLVDGEEQLLITKEGNLYLTNGDGTYTRLKNGVDVDNIITKDELKNFVEVDDLELKLSNFITQEIFEGYKAEIVHKNRDVLDKFSVNSEGKLLFDGKELSSSSSGGGSIDTSNLVTREELNNILQGFNNLSTFGNETESENTINIPEFK